MFTKKESNRENGKLNLTEKMMDRRVKKQLTLNLCIVNGCYQSTKLNESLKGTNAQHVPT